MESSTKYLLVIADLGHSSPRIPSLCKFLPHFGWQPIIITPKMDTSQRNRFLIESDDTLSIVETKNFRMQYKRQGLSLGSRILRFTFRVLGKLFLGWRYQYPDAHKKWEEHVIREAHLITENLSVSLILSSSSPVSCHVIAKRLSHSLKVPWIADLRDLWTQNHYYIYSDDRLSMERKLEIDTLSDTAALTTVTPQLAAKLQQMHKKKCFTIENGFHFRKHYPSSKPTRDYFLIVYTGQIYTRYQNISLVIKALETITNAPDSGPLPIKLAFYGHSSYQIEAFFAQSQETIPQFIELHGHVTRSESYDVQEKADVLLLLNWEDSTEKGVATTKLYEYLGSGIPILATGGFGEDYIEDILYQTKAGFYCKTEEEIKLQLKSWLEEWRTSNYIEMKRDEAVISYYSYENIAGRLVKIFEEVTS